MRRSVTCMAIGGMMLAFSFSAWALKSQNLDPRDPSIWVEKPVEPYSLNDAPCEVRSRPDCAQWEDEKSDIQRERERREQQRRENEREKGFRRD